MADTRNIALVRKEAIRQLKRHANAFEEIAERLPEGTAKTDLLWLIESQRDWARHLSVDADVPERSASLQPAPPQVSFTEEASITTVVPRSCLDSAVTVSVADASAALGLGRTTIDKLMKMGTLVRLKVGRRTLITVDSIQALIKAGS